MDVFAALADPTRRRILGLLARGSRSAGELASEFPKLTFPGVSRHLRILREARLVDATVDAQRRVYALRPEGLADLYAWVAKVQAEFPEALDSLERYLDAGAVGRKTEGRRR